MPQRLHPLAGVLAPPRGEAKSPKAAIVTPNPVYAICQNGCCQKEALMAETIVTLRLNQQQLELMDRTIAQGVAPDRVALVRLALREYAAARKAEAAR
jgi:hypothetical protein